MSGLIVDNFAGGGGASTGIEAALGRPVDVAINHDAEAVAMHMANHPATRHFCQSINAVDPRDATGGRPVLLAWFSPDCKHHSKAKGGKPREKNIRDLAWIVPHWVEVLQRDFQRRGLNPRDAIRCLFLENVEEFRKWGPLDEHGKPIKEREGEEFDLFVRRLKRLGGRVEFKELVASRYGAKTSRKRLYMIVRFDGLPIVWPIETHGKPGSAEVESGAQLPWGTAADCIDWSIPCPSIFDRKRPLKEATLRRIAHGTMRYVVNAKHPFIVRDATGEEWTIIDAGNVPITHSGVDGRSHPPGEPMRTITTANGGEFAKVAATLVQTGYGERPGQAPRVPHVDKPLGTAVAGGAKHGIVVGHLEKFATGNLPTSANDPITTTEAKSKHSAVAAFLSSFYTSNTNGGRGKPDLPLKTALAGANHHAVVCAHMEQANTGRVGHEMAKPVSTIVGKGCTQRLVETTLVEEGALPPELMTKATRTAAFLVKYYGSGDSQAQPADRPLDTVTTLARFAVVTVTIDAVTYIVVDIGMRMLTPRELARAQGFPEHYILDAVGPNGKPLSKAAQIRMIGNSVCPDVAEALIRANLPDECSERLAA